MKKQKKGGMLLSRIHFLSGRILAKKMKEHGISEINHAQGRIIFSLWNTGEMTIHDLGKKLSLGKSTLTTMLDRLEQGGYVVRKPAPGDRRKIVVALTEKNAGFKEAYARVSADMTKRYYAGFSESEIDAHEAYLERILRNVMEYEDGR